MAQFVDEGTDEGAEGQVEDTKINLRAQLTKYNVPDRVYKLLCDESITIDELSTFTTEDLKDWCDEHSLKTIERRRFLNAVKSLPNWKPPANVNANNPATSAATAKPKIVTVFLGNEEKEQLTQFDEMKNNVKNMMHGIVKLKDKSNVDKVVQEIDSVCDKIESFVKQLRNNLLKQVLVIYIYVRVGVLI